MNDQVLTIEQMQELIDLGIDTSEGSMVILEEYTLGRNLIVTEKSMSMAVSGDTGLMTHLFTLQDILEILPEKIITDCGIHEQVEFSLRIQYGVIEYSTTTLGLHTEIICKKHPLLLAAFDMLKWCKENNYIK